MEFSIRCISTIKGLLCELRNTKCYEYPWVEIHSNQALLYMLLPLYGLCSTENLEPSYSSTQSNNLTLSQDGKISHVQ